MNVRTLLALFAVLLPVCAQAGERPVLSPTSPWLIRFDDARCRAVREFGTGDQAVMLWIDQAGLEPAYNLTLVGKMARSGLGTDATMIIGDAAGKKRSYVQGKTTAGVPTITTYGVPLTPEQGSASRITFAGQANRGVALETGPLAAMLATMAKCSQDLVETLDRTRATLSAEATPDGDPGQWVVSDDYPQVLVKANTVGDVGFRLLVGADGRPTSCQITYGTSSDTFNDVVCVSVLQRARFKPAKDAAGKPTASYYTSRVRFRIPE